MFRFMYGSIFPSCLHATVQNVYNWSWDLSALIAFFRLYHNLIFVWLIFFIGKIFLIFIDRKYLFRWIIWIFLWLFRKRNFKFFLNLSFQEFFNFRYLSYQNISFFSILGFAIFILIFMIKIMFIFSLLHFLKIRMYNCQEKIQ